jgi:hypothetical protein
MNDLSTQQIVLLCLLVSFVTAVTTGISVISLLDQNSPQTVTQTVNRVVEKTVEKIIETPADPAEPIIEKVVETVVVNQEDLTVEAVEKNSKSLVIIYGIDRFDKKFFAGRGIVVNNKGKILVDKSVSEVASNGYLAEYKEGTFNVNVISQTDGVAFLEPLAEEVLDKTFIAVQFGDSQNLKLAQSVIVLSGQLKNQVETGIIASLETTEGEVNEEEVKVDFPVDGELSQINTSVSGTVLLGSILMNLKGEIVGIKLSQNPMGSFTPSNTIKRLIIS